MNRKQSTNRKLRGEVMRILGAEDWLRQWAEYKTAQPASKLISPLFSALFSIHPEVHWHAVTCMGDLGQDLSANGLQPLRVVMRRLMWSLNDESGGIGWGAPEAMGELMAKNKPMASEYSSILLSYIIDREGPDNYLEYPPLRLGAYWGIARLAQTHPDVVQPAEKSLENALSVETGSQSLLLLCLTWANLQSLPSTAAHTLNLLTRRQDQVQVYWEEKFQHLVLADQARKALEAHKQTKIS
ncbi:MAG: hypothetical protein R6V55_14720 [Desulfovermiculus sp.]